MSKGISINSTLFTLLVSDPEIFLRSTYELFKKQISDMQIPCQYCNALNV